MASHSSLKAMIIISDHDLSTGMHCGPHSESAAIGPVGLAHDKLLLAPSNPIPGL